MKISYDWLKDYVDIKKSPEQLAEDLSLFGQEVDSLEKVGDDFVLDIEITPNRGDCLSILGIARELAALYNLKIKTPAFAKATSGKQKLDKTIDIQISTPDICPRFTARIIDNVKIGQSPDWMVKRLESYGFRTLNNIVDITNYVMIATGQPLHAFDYSKIKDGVMNIRQAQKGEEVMTLDGKNHVLPDGTIIIEDKEKIYDLAGIMGGIKSEVDENTKTIVLQGAIFDPVLIRKTSKNLHHVTDASYRYERGVDYDGTVHGVDMATTLIKESCPEAKVGELIDRRSAEWKSRKIEIDNEKINKLLGIDLTENEQKEYLERLGFKVEGKVVAVPSYRDYDVKIWQDVAEEVARVFGYNRINKPLITISQPQNENQDWLKRETIKDILKDLGFTEIYSYSFAEKKLLEMLGEDKDLIEVDNPLSPETQFLRPSLLPSLISQIAKNPWSPDINIFEIEKVFDRSDEKYQLGIATVGKQDVMLKEAIKKLGINEEIKNVDQKILDFCKIRRPIKYIVVDLNSINNIEIDKVNNEISNNKYKTISKYPPTVRDLAFLVDKNVSGDDVEVFIKPVNESILVVELFDEFYIEKLKKKNIAFHIWLQDLKKPMKDEEVEKIIQTIIKNVEEKYQAKLRS